MKFKLLALLTLIMLSGCATDLPRADSSSNHIRERYPVSKDALEFGCSFAFQSTIENYVKNEINGSWMSGTCIVDSELATLFVGHIVLDRRGKPVSNVVRAVGLKSLGLVTVVKKEKYIQLQLASREMLDGQWSGVSYPRSKLILSTNTTNWQSVSERLSKFSLKIDDSSILVKQRYEEPSVHFDWTYLPSIKGR